MNIILNSEDVNFKDKQIFCDSETRGLHGDVRVVQIYCPELDEKNVYVYDVARFPLPLVKKRIKEASNVVGHNFKYDMDCLGFCPESWDDTYVLDTIINFNKDKHSLDDVVMRVWRKDMYADMFDGSYPVYMDGEQIDFSKGIVYDKKKMQKSDWSGGLTDQQYAYAAMDVWALPKVFESYDIDAAGWTYKLDKATIEAFAMMGEKLPIDVEWLEERMALNNSQINEMNLPINVNSYQQVRPYIGLDQSDDDALALAAASGNERAANVRTVRSLRKQNSFITKFLNERKDDDYVKGYLNIGTRSGRSKCSDMNLQQIPTSLKQMIQCKEGKYFVYADFAQLELRSLCVLIGEPILEKLFREKQDMHDYVRDSLFSADQEVSDAGRGNSLRQIAKIYNFACLYGAGWAQVGNVLTKYTGMILPESELKANKKKWLDTFPGIKAWHDRNIRHWQKKTVMSTPMGRKYIGKLPTDTNNIMNQGLGAEVAKLALVNMRKRLGEDYGKMLMFIHDSYTYEADSLDEAKEVGAVLAECMREAWYSITVNTKISDLPMPVDVFVGQNMNTIEKDGCLWECTYE